MAGKPDGTVSIEIPEEDEAGPSASASRVIESDDVTNGTKTLLDIAPGEYLYLTSLHLAVNNTSAAVGLARLFFLDGSSSIQIVWHLFVPANGVGHCEMAFPIPPRLGHNGAIRIASSAANVTVYGTITGYIEST